MSYPPADADRNRHARLQNLNLRPLTRPGPERKEFLGGVRVDTIHHLGCNPIDID
jgi:hypothetical protein